jgi:uncharacterized protein YacL
MEVHKMHTQFIFSRKLFFLALIFGVWAAYTVSPFLSLGSLWNLSLGLVAAVFFYLGSFLIINLARRSITSLNRMLDAVPTEALLGGTSGLFLGVLVGVLSTFPLSFLDGIGDFLTLGVFILSGYLGLKIGVRRAPDLLKFLPRSISKKKTDNHLLAPKVLDTSAIIDGRIYDVCLSNFLEGKLVVPTFVIEELQHIADSSDNIRRNKGRRGLELLSKMQKHSSIKIDIIEANIPEEKDVDSKLLRLCKQINACIITNDYNLNKVAELQGIKVLNINELTNAVKVIVYPGETMHIAIIKEGKEVGQGVGYLEDGTMVVVEDAHHEIGNELQVMVTSVFQTAAGRMIFTRKIREEVASSVNQHFQDIQEVKLYG